MGVPARDQQTLANQLAGRIRTDVMSAGLREGDLFMTTDQVVERYEVSRTIAREAVNQLSALGVLEGRQRLGLLVGRPDPVALMGQCMPFYAGAAGTENLRALAELRYVLEMGAIDFAATNATEEQKAGLVELAARFDKVTSEHGQNEEADTIELEFHALILSMTGNPLVAGMHRVLIEYFHKAVTDDPTWREVSASSVLEHTAIAQAITGGDTELARCLLRRHLENALLAPEGTDDNSFQRQSQ